MAFINQAVTVLQTLVIALGAGLAVWGVVNLMEGYGNDNPGAKSQGIKQLMAGGGVVVAVAFHEVDNTPHCETCAEGDNERLKNRDSLIDESHRFSSLI